MNLNLVVASLSVCFLLACGSGATPRDPGALNIIPAHNGERVVYGDSNPWYCSVYIDYINRAYPGDTTIDLLNLLENHYKGVDSNAEYVIMIGTNDIKSEIEGGYIKRMFDIFMILQDESVTVISILPTFAEGFNRRVREQNEMLENLTGMFSFDYQNVYKEFEYPKGVINSTYTFDGLHLNETGCDLLFNQILGGK